MPNELKFYDANKLTDINVVDNHSHYHLKLDPCRGNAMYVCICRQITDNQIRDLCRGGASNMTDLRARLGVGSECGKCGKLAQTIVKEFHKTASFTNAA